MADRDRFEICSIRADFGDHHKPIIMTPLHAFDEKIRCLMQIWEGDRSTVVCKTVAAVRWFNIESLDNHHTQGSYDNNQTTFFIEIN